MPEPLRLAVVTDIHHGEDKLTKRGSAALGLLDDFLAFAGDWGADVIIDLGDRISDIDADTDARLMREVADRFVGLNTPHAHLNGNHDVAFLGEEANFRLFGEPAGGRALEIKGWRLLFWQPDTVLRRRQPFRIRDADLAWLEAELPRSDLPTIVCTHAPLGGGSMVGNYWFQNNSDLARYPNEADARALLEAHGHVVLCLSGHVHWNSLHRANAIPYVTVQSLTESYTTAGAPAGAWATVELDDAIRFRAYGLDPIEFNLALRQPGEAWERPLGTFRR